MMGSLARTDAYYDPMTDSAVYPPEQPIDPAAFTAGWARISSQHPQAFEPQGTQWPQYPPPPPKEVAEDKPNPLIPFSAYRSKPPTHRVGDIAAQNIIEQGFGALPAGRIGMGTALTLDPSPAEGAGIDPRLWSRLSSVKLRKPLDEMQHTYTGLTHPTPRIIQPEQLLNETGLFVPWDISRTGGAVTHIDGNALARAVALHGGPGFPQANPGLAGASEHAISSRLDNEAAKITERTGKPPLIIPFTMGGSGVDASSHVASPLSQMVRVAPVAKVDMEEFNATMRAAVEEMEKKKKNPALRKVWKDTTEPDFEDYIDNMQGGMKVKSLMAKVMEQKKWQDKGFPNVAAVRHAVSEPNLIDLPTDTAGMTVSRYTPGKGLIDTSHPDYPKGVAGEHMGQLATLAPFNVFAPSISEGLAVKNAANKAAGKKVAISPAYHLGKPSEGIPTSQHFDDQWLENYLRHVKSVEER